ncbi:hypothetical protein [Yokenella regensburgei]|uniref:hypothetical protein n=1 Tax=Yokenella regensburgei TaxID=158877 RepID=UPI0020774F1E|nr:hypothetical protein [Yokenella regensburgei]
MKLFTHCTLLSALCLCTTQAMAFQSTSPELPFSAGHPVRSEQQLQQYSYSERHEPLHKTPLGGCHASPVPGCNYPVAPVKE